MDRLLLVMFAIGIMSKKHQHPVTPSTKNPVSIAIAFLDAGTHDHLGDLHKIYPGIKIAQNAGWEGIEEISQSTADLYLVAPSAEHVRNHQLQVLLKTAVERPFADMFFTMVSGENKSRMTTLFSGMGKAEWHNTFVAFGQNSFKKFIEAGICPRDAFELNYLAEKTCSKNEIIEGDKKEIAPIPVGKALSKKAKTSLWYYTSGGIKSLHRFIFTGVSILALLLCMFLSKDAGISGDEFTQYEYSQLTANYYEAKLGKEIHVDTNALRGQKMETLVKKSYNDPENLATQEDPERLMHLYGASFDTFTTLLIRWFGISDVMDFRHLINSIFGFLCMFFGALIVRRVTGGNWKYAWITLVMLFFTPRLLGESFNNPKDIPFAAGYVMAIYYTLKTFGSLRNLRLSSMMGLVVSVALGISIRIGGVLSIAIFIMYAGLEYIQLIGTKEFFGFRWKGFVKVLLPTVAIGICAYLLGIFFWPFGWDDPIANPMKALKSFSNYSGSIRQLFEGKMYDSDMLPSYYLIKYIFITTPIAGLLGLVLTLFIPAWKKTAFTVPLFLIFFAAIFPVLYIYIQKSQVYGGLRHILFTVPFFVMLGVLGFWLLEQWLKEKKWAAYAFPAAALGLTALPASFVAQNHPLEYIYFNELVGGTAGAYGSYEMDYYLAGLRPSTEWFLENVARKNPNQKYRVLTYGMDQVKYYCRKDSNVKVGFTRYDDRSEKTWDYTIFYNAYLDKERLMGGNYPPIGTVFTPKVAGKPMGLVIKRPSLEDYEGFEADRAGNYSLAISKYQSYLKKDPTSNEVYLYLAFAYANINNLDSAIWAAQKSVALYPEFSKALFALNQFYVNKKDFVNAIKVMDQYLESRPKDADAYLIKAQTQAQKGDLNPAIQSIQKAIELAPLDGRAYGLGSKIYQGLGDNLNANLYAEAAMLFQAKDDNQRQKGIEALKGIYQSITGKELNTDQP